MKMQTRGALAALVLLGSLSALPISADAQSVQFSFGSGYADPYYSTPYGYADPYAGSAYGYGDYYGGAYGNYYAPQYQYGYSPRQYGYSSGRNYSRRGYNSNQYYRAGTRDRYRDRDRRRGWRDRR